MSLGLPLGRASKFEERAIAIAAEEPPRSGRFARAQQILAHQGLLTLFDQACVSLTNFSTGILIARYCDKEELGLYMLGYSVVLFAVAFQQMLISSPYILIRPRLNAQEAVVYTGGAYLQQFALGSLLAATLLVAALGFHVAHSRLALVMFALSFSAPLLLFKEMFRRVCFAELAVFKALVVDVTVGVIQVAILWALARGQHLSAPTGILAVGIACSALIVSWWLAARGRVQFRIEAARSALSKNWALGRWILGSQLLWAFSLYSYPWLISKMHGVAAAGVWAACFGINALGNPLLLGLQSYIEPRVSHAFALGGIPAMRRLALSATAVLASTMMLFAMVIFFGGNWLAVHLYGPRYAGNGLIIFILTLSFAAGAAGFAFSAGFFAAGKGNLDLRISWVYPAMLIALGLPLVRSFGLMGGAASLLIAHSLASSLRGAQFLLTFRKEAGSQTQ